jgi:hypothetical protein
LGGGLDSFAMLLDAIGRGELPDLVVFADVGDPGRLDPGEWPSTYRHIAEVVMPLCAKHGIEFKVLDTNELPIRGRRSLFAYFKEKGIMPGRVSRLCTSAAKVERIADYLEARFPAPTKLEVWIGFEAGEENRAARDPHSAGKAKGRRVNRFPLIERKLCRCRCERLVRAAGYPIPRKSACVFCPFTTRGDFKLMAAELPETFAKVAKLEADAKRTKSGHLIRFGSRKVKGAETFPVLRDWVEPSYRRAEKPCEVCGAAVRATKATGCDYLSDAEAVAPEPGFVPVSRVADSAGQLSLFE